MSADGIAFDQAELLFERLAAIAQPMAQQAGVGELETVGHLVSYLLDFPRDIEPLLRFGIGELPDDWISKGRLSYQGIDGKIWRSANARRARVIKGLEQLP
jgi:hypothetical protein